VLGLNCAKRLGDSSAGGGGAKMVWSEGYGFRGGLGLNRGELQVGLVIKYWKGLEANLKNL